METLGNGWTLDLFRGYTCKDVQMAGRGPREDSGAEEDTASSAPSPRMGRRGEGEGGVPAEGDSHAVSRCSCSRYFFNCIPFGVML